MAVKTVSIVVPVYCNEPNLPETVPQLLALAGQLPPSYKLELVFVDDGSTDRSLQLLLDFQSSHPDTIRVAKLTRNFGSMAAIQAGFTIATGDCVGMISADLQDPPQLLVEMLGHWEKGTKAVFAVRKDRDESFLQKLTTRAYYSLVRRFALEGYPNGGFDFFLVDRQVINELNRIHEKNTNLMALVFWLGYKPVMIPYVRRARSKGKSRWTLGKKVKLFVDTFAAFTFFPIRALSAIGFVVAMTSFLYGAYILFYWLFFNVEVKGYVPIMLVITFASGMQMLLLGVLGEYMWRTLDEARKRPAFVVDEVFGGAQKVGEAAPPLQEKR
jgi:polyisoprenyl-phosphate glycosyltransferase